MTEQEQIEELGQDIYDNCPDLCENGCGGKPCYKCIAESLQHDGYRKLPEDSVVLSKEEFSKALTDNFNMGKKEAQFYSERVAIPTTRKETAEKFLQLAYDRCLEKSFIKKVEELAKQFGLEIKE